MTARFGKKTTPDATPEPATDGAAPSVRFRHPKVYCIDLPDATGDTLRAAGYRVAAGTLGTPYRVPASTSFLRPWMSNDLASLSEQEVIACQMRPPAATEGPVGREPVQTNELAPWSSCRNGIIDPRPLATPYCRPDIERILKFGGIVVCFAAPAWNTGLMLAEEGYGGLSPVRKLDDVSAWNAVPALAGFSFPHMNGEEIHPKCANSIFAPLEPHLATASYVCTIEADSSAVERWFVLARNKFQDPVAGVLVPAEKGEGIIVVLPQVADKGATLQALLDDVFPLVAPKLFPDSEKFAWRERAPYELAEVRVLRAEIDRIRAEADEAEQRLQAQIAAERETHGWMLDLLSGTGDEFVNAVAKALQELGLPDVKKLDEDEEVEQEGRLREDIRVGGSPILLVEAKGLNSLPKEEDTLAVAKYRAPRMEQLERLDIRGLAVINHQRNQPPLERQNEHTFQEDVITNARAQSLAVITGFDLFRLLLNKRAHRWPEAVVKPLFYENGRVAVVPTHYRQVGVVERVFPEAGVVGIRVAGEGFSVGDRLAYELLIEFHEFEAASIEVDNRAVGSVTEGAPAGVKGLPATVPRRGTRVFKVDIEEVSA